MGSVLDYKQKLLAIILTFSTRFCDNSGYIKLYGIKLAGVIALCMYSMCFLSRKCLTLNNA